MRGHIVKRSKNKNSWSIKISLGKDNAGKYRSQWYTVQGSKKDAEKRLSELLHQQDTGTYTKPGKQTLGDYLEHWLQDYCQPNLAPHTVQSYSFFINQHISTAIGNIPLTELKPEHLQNLYSEKLSSGRRDGTGGLGNRSVRYIHTTLHKALKHAVRMGMILRNPADAVESPKVKSHEMRVMSESDLHMFLEYARSTSYYTLFYTALFTAMRRSELLALRWSDIDLRICQISVSRTLHQLHNRNIIITQTKTDKSRRLIALSPSTTLVLRDHRHHQEVLRQTIGIPLTNDDLVFCQYDGKPLLPDSVSHAWHRLAYRTGLKGIRLHDARHTHASLMLKQGIHPKIVQERLGHASIRTTLDTYSHVAPGLQQAAAKRFDDILLPDKATESVQ